MRSPSGITRAFASTIYQLSFERFDTYCRQEVAGVWSTLHSCVLLGWTRVTSLLCSQIVGVLVTHVGSGREGEVEGGLSTLDALIQNDPDAMERFVVFLKVTRNDEAGRTCVVWQPRGVRPRHDYPVLIHLYPREFWITWRISAFAMFRNTLRS